MRWTLVAVGFALSGWFLLKNLYPVLAQADAKTSRLLIIVILAMHAGLAFALKIGFFSYGIQYDSPTVNPTPADPSASKTLSSSQTPVL